MTAEWCKTITYKKPWLFYGKNCFQNSTNVSQGGEIEYENLDFVHYLLFFLLLVLHFSFPSCLTKKTIGYINECSKCTYQMTPLLMEMFFWFRRRCNLRLVSYIHEYTSQSLLMHNFVQIRNTTQKLWSPQVYLTCRMWINSGKTGYGCDVFMGVSRSGCGIVQNYAFFFNFSYMTTFWDTTFWKDAIYDLWAMAWNIHSKHCAIHHFVHISNIYIY